jgi:tetratricopeptide (TPR) repeat protein
METTPTPADALRAAIENEPRKAELHYLLGAELAQNADYDGAVLEMSRALELDGSLHMCRFQLGLLLLTMALPDRARLVWADLEALDNSAPLWHFKRGLEYLIVDQFAACIGSLRTGIELNTSNPALNGDMQMVIDRAAAALEAASPLAQEHAKGRPQEVDPRTGAVRTDFSLYGTDRD